MRTKSLAMQELARAVRQQRKGAKLTQQELANFAGCGVAFIHYVESAKESIQLDKLLDVLSVLGLQLRLESGKNIVEVSPSLQTDAENGSQTA